jgi:hypothetical protein
VQYYLKIITKISVIVSGLACDQFDDQIGYAEPTINWKFKLCLAAILRHMENNFLENVPEHVTNACFDTMASRGFTGCAGSIDCSHVTWKCPKYLQAVCKGKENDTTIAMQAVVTPDLYCSSIFVGAPGSTNDRSILTMDGFFHNIVNRRSEKLGGSGTFEISGSTFTQNYYLADGIYPPWSIFAKPISIPVTSYEKAYTERHSSARKDVERFFGVLKQQFKIIRTGNRVEFRDKRVLCDIVKVCVILHNIMVRHNAGEALTSGSDALEHDANLPSAPVSSDEEDISSSTVAIHEDDICRDEAVDDRKFVTDAISRIVLANSAVTSIDEHERLRRALLLVFHTGV